MKYLKVFILIISLNVQANPNETENLIEGIQILETCKLHLDIVSGELIHYAKSIDGLNEKRDMLNYTIVSEDTDWHDVVNTLGAFNRELLTAHTRLESISMSVAAMEICKDKVENVKDYSEFQRYYHQFLKSISDMDRETKKVAEDIGVDTYISVESHQTIQSGTESSKNSEKL